MSSSGKGRAVVGMAWIGGGGCKVRRLEWVRTETRQRSDASVSLIRPHSFMLSQWLGDVGVFF